MYEFINGQIAELTPTTVVVEAAGVGYLMNISLQTYAELEHRSEAKVFTHFIVREDAQILYGFADRRERELFRLLISVSGVGGNTARMILSTYSTDELGNIIRSENATLLKNVKGLGLKTAQKIIVELRDKMLGVESLPKSMTGATIGSEVFDEAMSAMTMLGFGKAAAEKAVKAVMKEAPTAPVEEVIRMALKRL